MTEIIKDPETGLYHREYDSLHHIKTESCYKTLFPLINKTDVVLDIGAQIGFHTVHFASLAKIVIAVEPDPDTYKVLIKNIEAKKLKNVVARQEACVDTKDMTVTFYRGSKSCNSSLFSNRNTFKNAITVNTVSLKHLIKKYSPSVVKIDTEGAEYSMGILKKLPDHVKALAIEFHFLSKDRFQTRAVELAEILSKKFKLANKPNFKLRNYSGYDVTVGVWYRE